MEKNIKLNQLKINSVQIRIQCLLVDDKKMTLSVFKQIPLTDLVDWEIKKILGQPLGRVNYFVESVLFDGLTGRWRNVVKQNCLHVVFIRDECLFRSVIFDPFYSRDFLSNDERLVSEQEARLFEELKQLPQLFIAV